MIWVIGGTKDSRDFIELLEKELLNKIIVTVATEYGGKLLEEYKVKILVGKITVDEMRIFVNDNKIEKILDFSHPYAVEVSKNAVEIAKEKNIDYMRYERKNIYENDENHINFKDLTSLINFLETLEEKILVTLGGNSISEFKDLKNLKNIYFRILPDVEVLKKCRDSNILAKNIFAIQGPFSKKMNMTLIEEYNIKYFVTKHSGATGGEKEKIDACNETKCKMIFLDKPSVNNYSYTFDSVIELHEEMKKLNLK
ncbi:MAG: precorrin-6A reductase [Fusobacteriaceae bacterium]